MNRRRGEVEEEEKKQRRRRKKKGCGRGERGGEEKEWELKDEGHSQS